MSNVFYSRDMNKTTENLLKLIEKEKLVVSNIEIENGTSISTTMMHISIPIPNLKEQKLVKKLNKGVKK